MDPGSVITLANECIPMCIEAARIIKKIIEAEKDPEHDLLDMIYRAERTRKLLTINRILAQTLQPTDRCSASISIDQETCKTQLSNLLELAGRMAQERLQSEVTTGSPWSETYKDEAKELCRSIKAQEGVLLCALSPTNFTSDGLETVQKVQTKIDNTQNHVIDPVGNTRLRAGPFGDVQSEGNSTTPDQVWLGYIMKDGLEDAYIMHRDMLADAASTGKWSAVQRSLEFGELKWGERWANAFRLQPRSYLDKLTFWTPLHHAVFNDAPVKTVKWLIEHGASRTLRTRTSDFYYHNLTALELAKVMGHVHMYDVLRPVICRSIPHDILQSVQKHFHNLISDQLGDKKIKKECIRLPLLEPLTESADGIMWFPLSRHAFSDAGFAFRFDGRDLLVLMQNVTKQHELRKFRITEHGGAVAVERVLLVNEVAG